MSVHSWQSRPAEELEPPLAGRFTLCTYDRGRGDTAPSAVERETEDLVAVIGAVGGGACVLGVSSGSTLALEAADRGQPGAVVALAAGRPARQVPPMIWTDPQADEGDDASPERPGQGAALWQGGRVDTTRLGRLRTQVSAAAARVSDLARLRADAQRRVAAWQDAVAARDRAVAKIAATDLPPTLKRSTSPDGRLAALEVLKPPDGGTGWRQNCPRSRKTPQPTCSAAGRLSGRPPGCWAGTMN